MIILWFFKNLIRKLFYKFSFMGKKIDKIDLSLIQVI